jgi:hypothetical protein
MLLAEGLGEHCKLPELSSLSYQKGKETTMHPIHELTLEHVNRRRLLQMFAASVPIAVTPDFISAQVKAQFQLSTTVCSELTGNGEVRSAWYGTGKSKVQVQPNTERLGEGVRFQLLFTENDNNYLTATSEILRKGEDQALGRASLHVISKGIDYKVDFDASNILLTKGLPPVGVAKVQTSYNGKNWSSTFDYGAWHSVGGEGVPHLDSVLHE